MNCVWSAALLIRITIVPNNLERDIFSPVASSTENTDWALETTLTSVSDLILSATVALLPVQIRRLEKDLIP